MIRSSKGLVWNTLRLAWPSRERKSASAAAALAQTDLSRGTRGNTRADLRCGVPLMARDSRLLRSCV